MPLSGVYRKRLAKRAHGGLSPRKAKEILEHGEVRGHKLTKKQRGFFGARAGNIPIKRK